MKQLLHVLILLIFFAGSVSATDFSQKITVNLKKDEFKKILVKYGEFQKLFKFRWTLYTNDNLVVLKSYDKAVTQNMLSLKNNRQSFRFFIKPKESYKKMPPYFLVMFKEFDYIKDEAVFDIYLSDDNQEVSLKYL